MGAVGSTAGRISSESFDEAFRLKTRTVRWEAGKMLCEKGQNRKTTTCFHGDGKEEPHFSFNQSFLPYRTMRDNLARLTGYPALN